MSKRAGLCREIVRPTSDPLAAGCRRGSRGLGLSLDANLLPFDGAMGLAERMLAVDVDALDRAFVKADGLAAAADPVIHRLVDRLGRRSQYSSWLGFSVWVGYSPCPFSVAKAS